MNTLLLKHVFWEGRTRNVLVRGNRYACLDAAEGAEADRVADASGLALLPAFYNGHTHLAMSLLRGYADDMPLQTWLQDHIWPYEAKLTAADIRRGSDLSVREMLAGGTVFFNDMYFEPEETIRVVASSGLRAAIGITVMDNHSLAQQASKHAFVREWKDPTGGRIQLAIAPHAIYTVCERRLRECAEWAREAGLRLHIHLSETRREVADCLREHGTTPVRYLDRIGFLGPDVVAAHCVHVDAEEWDILASRGVTVVHCPCSNMKLGSGRFPYERAIASGVRVALGTDGCSSNNNVDMREEMKFAALLAKCVSAREDGLLENEGAADLLPASLVFDWATRGGAAAFGIDGGEVAEGKLADGLLVSLDAPKMQPCHHLLSNWVYAADSTAVKMVLCDGKIVYEAHDGKTL
ncbi:MAG: amidohydrolase [Bacteroidales bacterium]|nr:amidohydrolase [Bacteroidales bacterium]